MGAASGSPTQSRHTRSRLAAHGVVADLDKDIQRWMTQLLGRYSGAYASIQFRALQQFFKWRAGEDELPDPMGTDTGAPPRKTSPGGRTFITHGRNHARRRQPREQGAA